MCPQCGALLEPGVVFCDNCGSVVSQREVRCVDARTSEADTQILEGGPRLVMKGVLAILIAEAGLPNSKYYVMERDRVTLGRGECNDIIIDNPTVSLQHALLVVTTQL